MIVVDSSVWVAKFRGIRNDATRKLDAIEDPTTILIGDVILMELLQGAKDESSAQAMDLRMRRFGMRRMMTPDMPGKAAANYRALRRRGITVRTSIDMVIGTYCIDQQLKLLHDDRDFGAMEIHLGLRPA